MAPGLAILSSLANTSFLMSMRSNTASMIRSQSARSSIFKVPVSSAKRFCTSSGGEAALGGAGVVILLHHAQAVIQRLLFHFQDGDGNAGIGEIHRDAAAHGAGADDADLFDRQGRRVVRHVGNF